MSNFGIQIPESSLFVIALVLFLYVVVVSVFGSYFARFNNDINDFFFSGQRFSWWLPAASMVATGIGSYSFLKYSEQGFQVGMSSALTYLNDWFIIPFFIFGWLPIIYFAKIKSIPEYFERRFNSTAKLISMVIILAYMFFYIGYNFYTVGVAVEGLFGVQKAIAVPIIAFFLGFYVTFGGQTAVIFTDLFQGITLYIAGGIAIYSGIYALGGLEQFWFNLPVNHRLPFVDLYENQTLNTAGMFWGEAMAGSIAFAFMNQSFIMRYLTIKSVDEGRKAAFFNLLFTMPLSAIVVGGLGWIGKALIVKQTAIGGALVGYDFVNITNSFHTFLIICWTSVKHNPWIFGFIIAALLAALMSTIDSLINACAAVLIYDLYKPYVRRNASDKHYLKVARIVSMLSTLVGLSLVFIFEAQEGQELNLMSLHYKGIMIIIPSIVTTIFLGAFWDRFNSIAACTAMTLGSLLTILSLWVPKMIDPINWFVTGTTSTNYIYMRALFGMLVSAAIGVLVTFLTKNRVQHQIVGLTINTIQEGKKLYKGNEGLNESEGEILHSLSLEVDDQVQTGYVHIPQKYMEKMRAIDDDLIYISDDRPYLGGLRAGHVKAFALKGNGVNDSVRVSLQTLKECYLKRNKPVMIEKII